MLSLGPSTVYVFDFDDNFNLCVLDFIGQTQEDLDDYQQKFEDSGIEWVSPTVEDTEPLDSEELKLLRKYAPITEADRLAEAMYQDQIASLLSFTKGQSVYVCALTNAVFYRDRLILDGYKYRGSLKATSDYHTGAPRDIRTPLSLSSNVEMYTYPDYLREKPLQIDMIEGPISITKLMGFDRTVLLLGDEHLIATEEGCNGQVGKTAAELNDFFRILLDYQQKQDRVLDVFLEREFQQEATVDDFMGSVLNNYMVSLNSIFNTCIQGGQCWNHRIHATDIRTTRRGDKESYDDRYNDARNSLIDSLFNLSLKFRVNSQASNTDIMTYVFSMASDSPPPEMLVDFLKESFLKDRKLEKQFEAVKNSKIRDFLHRKFQELMSKVPSISLVDAFFKQGTREGLFAICAGMLDLFAVARMFRSYNQIPGVYSEDAKDIVMYAGDAHISRIRGYLEEIGMEVDYQIDSKMNKDDVVVQCVPMFNEMENLFDSEVLKNAGVVEKVQKERMPMDIVKKAKEKYPYLIPFIRQSSYKGLLCVYLYYAKSIRFTQEYIEKVIEQENDAACRTIFLAFGIENVDPTIESLSALLHNKDVLPAGGAEADEPGEAFRDFLKDRRITLL